MLHGMHLHSTPYSRDHRPCWHCTAFVMLVYSGTAARCSREGRICIQAAPSTGCAFWEREVGADDEPGPPAADAAVRPMVSHGQPVQVVAWAP